MGGGGGVGRHHVHPDIQGNLLKSHCCSFFHSFYGDIIQMDSKICIQWNKSVRKIVDLPNNTHWWILGPLLNQPHISHQLYIRDVKFIYRLLNCHKCIVKECLTADINNSNTIIGYKLAVIRSRFGINVIDTRYDVCLHNIIDT